MPLRPILLDLREYPLCERSMRLLSFLEQMNQGDTLLVVNDRDPAPLLEELKPLLETGYSAWVPESGPEIWHILISREEPENSIQAIEPAPPPTKKVVKSNLKEKE